MIDVNPFAALPALALPVGVGLLVLLIGLLVLAADVLLLRRAAGLIALTKSLSRPTIVSL